MKQYGTIIWIDDRTNKFEGQILSDKGVKFYFNYSVWLDRLTPLKGQFCKFTIDSSGLIDQISDLCGAKLK